MVEKKRKFETLRPHVDTSQIGPLTNLYSNSSARVKTKTSAEVTTEQGKPIEELLNYIDNQYAWKDLPPDLKAYWRFGPGADREEWNEDIETVDDFMRGKGELITDPNTKLEWHITHAPFSFKNGSGTTDFDKSLHQRTEYRKVKKIIQARIDAAAGSGLPMNPIINFDGIRVAHEIRFEEKLNLEISLTNARLRRSLFCADITFLGSSSFGGAVFADSVVFRNCKFATCEEKKLRPTGGAFHLTTFDSSFEFDEVEIECDFMLNGTEFRNKTSFKNLNCSEEFLVADCIFRDDTEFIDGQFQKPLNIQHCVFVKDIKLESCTMNQTFACKYVTISGDAIFNDTILPDHANFSHSRFLRTFRYKASPGEPEGPHLDGAVFDWAVFFGNVSFEGLDLGNVSFRKSIWHAIPDFEGTNISTGTTFDGAFFPCIEHRCWKFSLSTTLWQKFGAFCHSVFAKLAGYESGPAEERGARDVSNKSDIRERRTGDKKKHKTRKKCKKIS